MVIFLLKIAPLPHQRREVLEILRCVVGPTTIQMGCMACEVYEEVGDDPTILYLELWESLAAAQRHIQSPMFAKILAVIDMSSKQPDIHFYQVAESWGLELVEKMRSQRGVTNV